MTAELAKEIFTVGFYTVAFSVILFVYVLHKDLNNKL